MSGADRSADLENAASLRRAAGQMRDSARQKDQDAAALREEADRLDRIAAAWNDGRPVEEYL